MDGLASFALREKNRLNSVDFEIRAAPVMHSFAV